MVSVDLLLTGADLADLLFSGNEFVDLLLSEILLLSIDDLLRGGDDL